MHWGHTSSTYFPWIGQALSPTGIVQFLPKLDDKRRQPPFSSLIKGTILSVMFRHWIVKWHWCYYWFAVHSPGFLLQSHVILIILWVQKLHDLIFLFNLMLFFLQKYFEMWKLLRFKTISSIYCNYKTQNPIKIEWVIHKGPGMGNSGPMITPMLQHL